MPDPAPAPLDPEMFVRQCTLVDRQLNADPAVTPNFVTADFLIARAIIETGVTQSIFSDPFCTGPFRLSWTEWIDFLNSELQTHSLYQLPDVIYPMAQVYAAGFSMHAAGKAFADTWAAGDAPDGDAEPFVPSYLDLFHAYLTDVATAVAIRKNETDTNKLLSDIASLASIAPIASRAQLSQVNGSMTITAFVAATEAVLAAALDAAFDKIKTLAPDELPSGGNAGTAPWFQVAQAEQAAGVSEATAPDRIRSYFAAVPQSVGATIPAWCGAFAAFCMRTSNNPVPAGAARAANWTVWGSQTVPLGSHNIPIGAVIVLTEVPGTTGTHGHVGFFPPSTQAAETCNCSAGISPTPLRSAHFPPPYVSCRPKPTRPAPPIIAASRPQGS